MAGSSVRQVLVDDTDRSIVFTGTWGHDQGISGVASASDEKILGPAYNSTGTFSNTDSSLSFTFTGTSVQLNGGINFVPTGTFGRCFIDGVVTDNSTDLMLGSGVVGTNDNPLCIDPGLSDGTHVLTFNLSGIGTYTAAPGANGAANGVWVDQITYTPSTSVNMNQVPAILVFPGDSQLTYSAGWTSNDNVQATSQQDASVTFSFQGTSVDYYGTLLNNDITPSSSATFFIDGQPPNFTVPLVNFQLGTTSSGVPLFRSGILPAGKHTLTVVNHGNSTVVPLGLQNLIFVPSEDSAKVTTAATTSTATTSAGPASSGPTSSGPTSSGPTSAGSTSAPTSVTSSPPGTSLPPSDTTKKNKSTAIIGAVVGVVVGLLLIILCLLLFLRRRRQRATRVRRTSILGRELKYPDISAIPRPEVPTPLPLPMSQPESGNNGPLNRKAQYFQDPSTSPPNSRSNLLRQEKSRLGYTQPSAVQGAIVRPQPVSNTDNPPPPPMQPSSSSNKAAASRTRRLSDIVINHDDSGMRIPQPEGEETPVRRIVEFPPTYAP